jgi:hypothetical protein
MTLKIVQAYLKIFMKIEYAAFSKTRWKPELSPWVFTLIRIQVFMED